MLVLLQWLLGEEEGSGGIGTITKEHSKLHDKLHTKYVFRSYPTANSIKRTEKESH